MLASFLQSTHQHHSVNKNSGTVGAWLLPEREALREARRRAAAGASVLGSDARFPSWLRSPFPSTLRHLWRPHHSFPKCQMEESCGPHRRLGGPHHQVTGTEKTDVCQARIGQIGVVVCVQQGPRHNTTGDIPPPWDAV